MTESAQVISFATASEDRHRRFRLLRPLAQAEEVEIGTPEAAYSTIAPPALSLRPQFVIAPIATFAPEPYEVDRPLPVTIYKSGEEYTASLFDANLHTSGDNEQEAFQNLKSLILDTFDGLTTRSVDELGPGPRRQLEVLKHFIRSN